VPLSSWVGSSADRVCTATENTLKLLHFGHCTFNIYFEFCLKDSNVFEKKMNALINLKDCREYIIITLNEKDHQIKLAGTIDNSYFCGKDICIVLGYSNIKKTLHENVKDKYKKDLKTLYELVPPQWTNSIGPRNLKKLTYHDGKAVYINEAGLYSLLSTCKHPNSKPLKAFMDQYFYDLRYKSGIMDIFAFIRDKKVAIDVNSPWFQELWYPISKKIGILLTTYLLEWMGYAGEYKIQKQNFVKLLDNNKIPYEEISYTDHRFIEYPGMKKEIEQTNKNILMRKKWLVMNIRDFKKTVIRLNTKNGEIVRDYYLNLEEACFEYAEYQAAWLAEKAEMERKIANEKLEKQMAMLSIKDKELKQAEHDKVKAEQDKVKAEQDKVKAEQDKEKERKAKEQALLAQEKAERKALNVQKFMNRITVREHKLEWIYIGTTRLYAQERLFKIGSTTRLTSRIPQYNTGRPGSSDPFYYAWAIKCYNAKDVDFYIQKLLFDFKFKDPQKASEEQVKDNRAEMYHGIKFSDLKDILTFIVNNYDQSIEYINNFIKVRLSQSLEEEDEIPPALDLKKITYQIGDHEEVIDLEKEDEKDLKKELKNIMRCYKEQQTREEKDAEVVVIERKELMSQLNQFTNESKTGLWNRIKELTGWKASKVELEQSDSEESEGSFKYKIKYK